MWKHWQKYDIINMKSTTLHTNFNIDNENFLDIDNISEDKDHSGNTVNNHWKLVIQDIVREKFEY